eukprot:1854574-Prymnesium_polylepis.1
MSDAVDGRSAARCRNTIVRQNFGTRRKARWLRSEEKCAEWRTRGAQRGRFFPSEKRAERALFRPKGPFP